MADIDKTAGAFDLAVSVTKLACSIWIGSPAVQLAGTIADLLRPRVASRLEQHRLEQVFSECTGIVATKLLAAMDREFRSIPPNERAAATLAARNTLERAGLEKDTLIQADLVPGRVLRWIKPVQDVVLQEALLSEGAEELYKRTLEMSCRYLVEIVTTLPRFEADSLVEVLRRQRVILETLNRILGQMPASRPASDFTTDYCRLLERQLDWMELFGVTLLEESSRVYPLTVSYVNLTLLDRNADAEEGSASARVEEALAGKSRMLLIGEAGSGKTTLLRWIAVKASRSDFAGRLAAWNDCTPFFIPLRTFADGNFPPPERFLDHIARVIASEMPPNWVHEQLHSGQALVLVDGVDELASGDVRDAARAWLQELIAAFPAARYIVTSRPAAVSERWTQLSDFSVAEVQPMDTADVRRFIRRWHDAMRWAVPEDGECERTDADERALLAAIDEDRLLRSLTESPLLCALLCALNRDRHGNLPRQRMAIYEAALIMLLERRDVDRKMGMTISYTANDLIVLLQDLAYWLLKNGWSDVAVARAEKQLQRSMRYLSQTDIESSTLLRLLLERSGLLRTPVEGRVDFVHRTFQEYLAGKAVMDNDDVGELIRRAFDDQWRDVVVMSAGHARPKQAAELLHGLLRQAKNSPAPQSLNVLTVACLQTVRQLDPTLREEIRKVAATLIPPKSKEAADAIVYAGPGMLELLASTMPKNLLEASAYVRTASLIGGAGALRIIGDIAESFDGLEEDLTRAWGYFTQDEFARVVLSRARLEAGLVITDERLMGYVAKLTSLRRLEISDLDIQNLLRLGAAPPNVTTLAITRCPLLNLRGLEKWHQVTHLRLSMSGRLPDLAEITKLELLEVLELTFRIGRVIRLDPIAELPALRSLRLARMDHVLVDLTPLRDRQALEIFVPQSAIVEGAESLGPGSRLIRL